MAAILKHWREAATLLLFTSSRISANRNVKFQPVSSTGAHVSNSKEDYDILLLKRSGGSKFMPNKYVFPGGVADDSDFSDQWLKIYEQLGSTFQKELFHRLSLGNAVAAPMFSRERASEFTSIPAEVAFRICAIRETFEESGVLVAMSVDRARVKHNAILSSLESSHHHLLIKNTSEIKLWRDRVNQNPSEFITMCEELRLVPAIWALYEWSNWLTPVRGAENTRRFDTAFYICNIDDKPEVTEDAGETVGALWASPKKLLTQFISKQSSLGPPQLYELCRLLEFTKASELFKHISNPDNERVERWMPVLCACKDGVVGLMPGDELYPETPDFYHPTDSTTFSFSGQELLERYPQAHRFVYMGSTDNRKLKNGMFQIQNLPPRRNGQFIPTMENWKSIADSSGSKL